MSEGPPAVRSLVEHLGEELVELGLSSPRIIALPGSALPDSPSVFLLASGRAARAVLHWSPAGSGDVVARGTRRAEGAIEALGPELSTVVLRPILHGDFAGRSYALTPWGRPLSNSRVLWVLQRFATAPRILGWLLSAAETTCQPVPLEAIPQAIRRPLE